MGILFYFRYPYTFFLLLVYFKIALFVKQHNLSEELNLLGVLFTIPILLAYLLMVASNIADSMSEDQNNHNNFMIYIKFIFKILFFTVNVIVLIYGMLHFQKITSNTIFIFFFILDSYILSNYILKLLKKGVIFFKDNDNFIAVIKLIISLTSGFIAFIGSITALLVAIDKFLH